MKKNGAVEADAGWTSPPPLAAQSFGDVLQGMLLGEGSSCSPQPHLPCAAELCWPRHVPAGAAAAAGCERSSPAALGQMLQASSLEPQIHNWLPAGIPARPVLPWELQQRSCHGQPGHGTAVPGTPRACWARTASSRNTDIQISICPCCFSAHAPPVLHGNTGASPGCGICAQFLEMSVYVGQYLWGIFVACSLFPTIPPFFPQKHLKAVQFCS